MSSRSNAPSPDTSLSSPSQCTPSTSRHVDAGGLNLHYLDYGTAGGRPMVCVHGGAAHAHWFDFVASGFTADHHVLALDLRGHGNSARAEPPAYSYRDYASDVAHFAEALDLRDFVLIGHSMGGIVATVYAATYPGRVSRFVVVDSRMHMSSESVARLRDFGTRPATRYATRDDLVQRYRLEPPGTMIAPLDVIRHVAERSGRELPDGTWTHKFDRSLYSIFESLDATPFWDEIAIPALLVKGERSNRIDAASFAEIRKRSPLAELAEVPHSDHHVTLDNPQGFVEAVRRFLEK